MTQVKKSPGYPANLFLGMDEKDQKTAKDVLQYSPLISRLVEIIEGYKKGLSVSRSSYDKPSWAYLQAHLNGELQAYENVLKLLRPSENK